MIASILMLPLPLPLPLPSCHQDRFDPDAAFISAFMPS